ncbi:MAG: FdtA/QdtA family cupin domain-containing protein [Bacteroidaceae bacterium]|nr:FdtA/QdtA family cupin domain-containing protein [Bacteroidaceae bacterium]
MKESKKNKARIIPLGKIRDKRGNLSVIEDNKLLPFTIARTYWVYDVPGGESRGGHAYHKNDEFIIALSGSFDLYIHNGEEELLIHLDRCNKGVYIPAGTWRRMQNFATNSIALVICSAPYSPRDYIRDFDRFIQLKESNAL